jgi:hypothetical protein
VSDQAVTCPLCHDSGHVCENHPGQPWGGLCCDDAALHGVDCAHGACGCGGAGMPCPGCCDPLAAGGRIGDAFTPTHLTGVVSLPSLVARCCPTCFSLGPPRGGCQDLWHVEVRHPVVPDA